MKAVIFAGGCIGDYSRVEKYLSDTSLIVCADSGIRHAFKMGIIPHLVVGDMDSASEEEKKKIEEFKIKKISFPKEKDFTDTELALEVALQEGANEAVLLGGLGDRPDHSLANILLMVNFKRKGLELTLAGKSWEMFLIDGQRKIKGQKGQLLSLLPITPKVTGIKASGLYYPLRDETLFMGTSRGISNVFIDDEAVVEIKEGMLIAVKCIES
ncbi:thiamine diphosphokinase [Thermovorax subterraneus]|nr:thiamine diphosphokinase [Thermovorax subterraneus]